MQGLFELPEHEHAHDHSDIRAEMMHLATRLLSLESQLSMHETVDALEQTQLEHQLEEVQDQAETAEALATLALVTPEPEPIREEEAPDATPIEHDTGSNQAAGETSEPEEEQPVVLAIEPEPEPERKRPATRFTRGR